MVWMVWPFVLSTLLSFASGYGVRELISRHRHAVAREKCYARKQYQARFQAETSVTPLTRQPAMPSRHASAAHSEPMIPSWGRSNATTAIANSNSRIVMPWRSIRGNDKTTNNCNASIQLLR
jgi:hypothetical protein